MMLLTAPDEMPVILSISFRVVRRNTAQLLVFFFVHLSSYLALTTPYRIFIVKLTTKVIYVRNYRKILPDFIARISSLML
jgi:hypothetical protein